MSRLINFIVFVCVLSMCAFGVWAEPNPPNAPAPALPKLLTTVETTQVILYDIQPDEHRLVLKIRNSDVTAMPSRSALHLSFDAHITDISEPRAPMPLRLETAINDRQVTFFLTRDPFAFPQPWSYTVTIAFDHLPQTGAITLGNAPQQHVTYPSTVSSAHATPLPGT
ncbi:hypothetical protein C2W62_21795 [Candidatus Entotheonella serta]|nr:hypothetical protein C2W62_21795 [Candidatus Entotheonella serta]